MAGGVNSRPNDFKKLTIYTRNLYKLSIFRKYYVCEHFITVCV